jgi:energy-coupling factor transporter ATP-binding protein EcfA2
MVSYGICYSMVKFIDNFMESINLPKFFQATNPSKTLRAGDAKDDQYYVDFSSVRGGKLIEELRGTIADLSPDMPTCSLFTGHIGCGKSTELLQLQKLLEADGFHVVYFESSDDLEMADVDIGDVMLAIAKRISESLENAKVNVEGGKLRSLVAKTKEILLTPIEVKAKAEIPGAAKLAVDTEKKEMTISALIGELTVKAKNDGGLREKLNQFVVPQKNKLVEAINEGLIVPAIEQLKKHGKKGLAVIVDNLDRVDSRVRPDGKSQHEYLFIDQSECLTKLACHLVYTLPLSMKFGNEYGMLTQRYDDPLVLPMVPPIDRDGNSYDVGMVLLRQMVLRRAMPEGTDEERLVRLGEIFENGEALDRLCRISGGHSRDLMRLLNSWIKKGQQLPLKAETLERVIRERRNEMGMAISDDEWELLRQVRSRKKVSGDEEFQILISSRWVFEYRQEEESWFDVNPILLEAAEMQN